MQKHKREYTFIYNRNKVRDKKLLARAKALDVKINEIDLSSEPLTKTHFSEIASDLKSAPIGLLDKRLVNNLNVENNEDALKLINKNPDLVKTPIILSPELVTHLNDFTDITALEQDIEHVA